MSDGSLLERVQQQVADRQHVDWDAVMARLRAENAPPDEVDAFSLLRLLDEVGTAHSSFQSGEADDGPSVATVPMPEPVLDDTLEAWGRYMLDEKVGRGGFGSVYRAWDPDLHMPVAIKILHRRFSDERLKDRLLQEGRALAQVKHQNVVRVLNVEQHDGRLGLVMEFIPGDTVDAMVTAQGMLNEREATVIAEDVCRALIAVHNNGLIHRDVKARNIIRERAGRIVLMDFGAGLPLAAASEQGRAVGTPLYMAPEILKGRPPSVASDVYSVGVLLFYLVSGRYPYDGESVDRIREAQANGRGLSLIGLRPDLPVPFVKVVDRALAVDPKDRYPTPAAVLQGLHDAREARPALKARVGRFVAWGLMLAVGLTLAGLLSSAAYNRSLNRGEFGRESALTWLRVGAQSLFMPILLSLLGAGAIGAIAAVRRVILPTSARVRAIDERLASGFRGLASRLGLSNLEVCASWLMLLTALALTGVWVYWAPFLQAVTSEITVVPRETLTILSPPYVEYRTHYRMLLSVLVALNVVGWYALARAAAARGTSLPRWVALTEISMLVLLFGSMQVPYRLVHEMREVPLATWNGVRCSVIGERGDDVLLFCPAMSPRNHKVARAQVTPTGRKGHLFADFAPPAQ